MSTSGPVMNSSSVVACSALNISDRSFTLALNASCDLAQSCAHRRTLSAGMQSSRFLRQGGTVTEAGGGADRDGDAGADWGLGLGLPSPPALPVLSVELTTLSTGPISPADSFADEPEPVTDDTSAAS